MFLHGAEIMEQKKQKMSKDLLEGKTLEFIVNFLVDYYGWEQLGTHINIKCFTNNPSVQSSLKFLRKTPWARKKVEELYLSLIKRSMKNRDSMQK
jgi:uncharacterized protein (DUF2132 family)